MNKHGIAAASLALAAAALLPATVAYADASPSPSPSDSAPDDSTVYTAPPATPEETNLFDPTDPAAEPTEDPGMNHPGGNYCDWYGGYYEVTANNGRYMRGVGASQSNYNSTSHTMTSTFTATASATVGVSLSASTEVSINALIAKQKATLGITLSSSLTATLSNSVTATASPHKTINATYGVWRQKITGRTWRVYSNCTVTAKRTVVSYSPWKVGWYVWES
jgi:hypothetical protein